jgi:hypothetical protein
MTSPTTGTGQRLVVVYMAVTALVLALLMAFGLLMRASQANLLVIPRTASTSCSPRTASAWSRSADSAAPA